MAKVSPQKTPLIFFRTPSELAVARKRLKELKS